jgi:hypothetical protein
MNEQIKELKELPLGVKVASVFLLAVYAAMCFMVPMVGLWVSVSIGTILAILRIIHWLNYGI